MTTIDRFDISVYEAYARRTEYLETIKREIPGMDRAESIPPQTQVTDFRPRPSEVDLLLGVARTLTPWAVLLPPPKFASLRRSPFSVARVAPTLGSQKEQDEAEEAVAKTVTDSPEQEREKVILLGCLQQITKINTWLGRIVVGVHQFLQA